MVTLYLKEQSAYRYYRERLFEQMAKKALEQAEYVYKNRGGAGASSQSDGEGAATRSRVFAENKRLRKEVEGLKQEKADLALQLEKQTT